MLVSDISRVETNPIASLASFAIVLLRIFNPHLQLLASMGSSNRACVWVAKHTVEVQQRPIEPVDDHDVLVKVISTGICGSDCHNWESDRISHQLVLGHESSGIIEAVGKAVTNRSVGQRVAIEPGFPCMMYGPFLPDCHGDAALLM